MPKALYPKRRIRKVLQIATGDVIDGRHPDGNIAYRNTLFVLTDDGQIWTRECDEGFYGNWFSIHHDLETLGSEWTDPKEDR